MAHVTCMLTAKNRDQLRNPTLGNRVWTTFFTRLNRGTYNVTQSVVIVEMEFHTTHHAGRSSLPGDCCSSAECSPVVCSFCAIAAAVPPRPQDGTACFSHRTLHHSVQLCDRLRKVSFGRIKHTNKNFIETTKKLFRLLLTFRPLSEAFIRRSWY